MRYRVDDAQLARAVAQLSAVGATWDARLRRIKRIAEAIQRGKETERWTRAPTRHDTEGEDEMVDILHRVGVEDSLAGRGVRGADDDRWSRRLVDERHHRRRATSAA